MQRYITVITFYDAGLHHTPAVLLNFWKRHQRIIPEATRAADSTAVAFTAKMLSCPFSVSACDWQSAALIKRRRRHAHQPAWHYDGLASQWSPGSLATTTNLKCPTIATKIEERLNISLQLHLSNSADLWEINAFFFFWDGSNLHKYGDNVCHKI